MAVYELWHPDGVDPECLSEFLERRGVQVTLIVTSPASDRTVIVYVKDNLSETDMRDLERRDYSFC